MINKNIIEGLERRFQAKDCNDENFKLVFWHFDSSDSTTLDEYQEVFIEHGWELIDPVKVGPLAFKSRIQDEPEKQFIYLQCGQVPDVQHDPVLDLRLASPQFFADTWTIVLDELGMGARPDLLDFLRAHPVFFSNSSFVGKLKSLGLDNNESAQGLETKMLAALSGATDASLSNILLGFLEQGIKDEKFKSILAEHFLHDSFWNLVQSAWKYSDANPSFSKLILTLLANDFEFNAKSGTGALRSYRLAEPAAAFRFCQLWRNTHSAWKAYTRQSQWFRSSMEHLIESVLNDLPLAQLLEIRTIPVEKYILVHLSGLLKTGQADGLNQVVEVVSERLSKMGFFIQGEERENSQRAYRVVLFAARFMLALETFNPEPVDTIPGFIKTYCEQWYVIDQNFRLFHSNMDVTSNWDYMKDVREAIDNAYANVYLRRLADSWELLRCTNEGTVQVLPREVSRQQNFFAQSVAPLLEQGNVRRVFVIISDALRYEIAQELSEQLAIEMKFSLQLDAVHSVLPSITHLGMAATLPHDRLEMNQFDQILVDQRSSSGLEARNKILASKNGIAVSALDFVGQRKEDARNQIKEASIVYLYHDQIDATGDKAVSEDQCFTACNQAIDEIKQIIGYLHGSLAASRIIVTADHGFIYTPWDTAETARSSLPLPVAGEQKTKKRYIIGQSMTNSPGAWRGSISDSIPGSPLEYLVPRGMQLFHFKGGARFFHGGIMPQETIVPVLLIQPESELARARSGKRKVDINVAAASIPQTVTTRLLRIKLFQDSPVSDTILPRLVKVGVYHDTDLVSDSQTWNADSASTDFNDLTKVIQLHLIGESFDPKAVYHLSVKDDGTGQEIYGQDIKISLIIHDEF